MAPFMQILTNATIIAAFGNDHTAMLMYDTKTVPVRPVPGAECVTVENGKTTRSWFVVTGPRSRSRNTGPHATRPSSHPLQDYVAPLAGRRRCRGVTGRRFGICLRSSCA